MRCTLLCSPTGAGEGNRTLVVSLEGFCSTIELHPRGLHPFQFTYRYNFQATSWWRGLDSNQRTHREQIYSLSPLTTRPPLREEPQSMKQAQLGVNSICGINSAPFTSLSLRGVIVTGGFGRRKRGAEKLFTKASLRRAGLALAACPKFLQRPHDENAGTGAWRLSPFFAEGADQNRGQARSASPLAFYGASAFKTCCFKALMSEASSGGTPSGAGAVRSA